MFSFSMSKDLLKLICLEVEQSSYEDDLQILRVIEAYCFSKQRQTITNSGEVTASPTLGVEITRLTLNFPSIILSVSLPLLSTVCCLVLTLDPSDREDSCQPLLTSQCPACSTDRSEAYIRQETKTN